ncbi:hypothetical protein BDW69DRAFT_173882 [Aspergillus filifer]
MLFLAGCVAGEVVEDRALRFLGVLFAELAPPLAFASPLAPSPWPSPDGTWARAALWAVMRREYRFAAAPEEVIPHSLATASKSIFPFSLFVMQLRRRATWSLDEMDILSCLLLVLSGAVYGFGGGCRGSRWLFRRRGGRRRWLERDSGACKLLFAYW